MALAMDGQSSPSQRYARPGSRAESQILSDYRRDGSPKYYEKVFSPRHSFGAEDLETRPIPIPPLVRFSAPKGITNGASSPNVAGPWRPASASVKITPKRQFHSPQDWSLAPDLSGAASLLQSLGVSPTIGNEHLISSDVPRAQLPVSFARRGLQQCEEGCYWRWLTHALLVDVGELKQNRDDVQEDHRQLCKERRGIEEKLGNYDRLLSEIECMSRKLAELRIVVPRRREECQQRQEDVERKQQEHTDLQHRRQSLEEQIKNSIEAQKFKSKLVSTLEHDAEEAKEREKTLRSSIAASFEDFQKLEVQNKKLNAERDALKAEVQALEARRGKKRRGKSKSPRAK